ncbi:MAG: type II secretion system protein [Candidatus Zixiibacteriota bacterium]
MFSRFHNRKGFTLIELMIVVVIIGILAALAIPRFMQASSKAKQSEAKQILKQIYTMQHAYRQANPTYGDAGATAVGGQQFPQIGVEIQASANYSYNMSVANATNFTCIATWAAPGLDDDATADVWQIIETGALTNTTNDVNS